MEQFEAYLNPRKNIYSWFKFFTYHQEIGQSFDDYPSQIQHTVKCTVQISTHNTAQSFGQFG